MAASCTETRATKGSLILEAILALAVLGLCVGPMSALLASLQSEIISIQYHRRALYEAASLIGKTMNAEEVVVANEKHGDDGFLSLVSTGTTTITGSTSASDDSLLEYLSVQDMTPCKKSLTSFVSWKNTSRENATSTLSMSFVATDPTEDKNLGGDCLGDEPHQQWTAPASRPIAVSVQGQNSVINAIDAENGIMVAVSSSSIPGIITFQYQPPYYSQNQSLNHDGTLPTQAGFLSLDSPAAAVDLVGGYAYLAVTSSTSQLRIVSVVSPAQPAVIASTSLPGVAGSYPGGLSVFYYASMVYVGTHRTAGHEFHVYDVTSPRNPKWLGSIELNHNINDIVVRGNYAYLATSGNIDDIIILDVSNPTAIKQVSALTFAGTEDTESVFLIGATLYAGRKKGSSSAHPEFYAIDVSDPVHPAVIFSFSVGNAVTSIKVAGNYVFIATNNPAKTFMVLDVGEPSRVSVAAYRGLNAAGTSLDYENDMVFIAAGGSMTLFTP